MEARQFQNIQLTFVIQQHQRGQANITADPHVHTGRFRHLTYQRSDCAFPVGTGDRDDRCLCFATEQLNVADNFNSRIGGGAQRRMRQGNTRAGDNKISGQQPVIIQAANMTLNRFR